MMPKRKKQNGKGLAEPGVNRPGGRTAFSLAELLVVVVILAVAFMLVQVDSTGMDQMKLMAAADTLQSDIRLLQHLARTADSDEVYLFMIQPQPVESADAGGMEMWDALACADGGAYVNHGLSILPQSANALTYLYSVSFVANNPIPGGDATRKVRRVCCMEEGCDVLPEDECRSGGGLFLGNQVSCADDPCAGSSSLTGVCCTPDGGAGFSCADDGTWDDCQSSGEEFYLGITCDYNPCEDCVDDAACVDGDACTRDSCQAGDCVQMRIICDDDDPCTDDSCDSATGCDYVVIQGCNSGACCIEGNCTFEEQTLCSASGGEFHDGATCGSVECAAPSDPIGACCAGGLCYDGITQAACQGAGGSYQGAGSSCSLTICSSDEPPELPEAPGYPAPEPAGGGSDAFLYVLPPLPDISGISPEELAGVFDDYVELPGAAYALVVVNISTGVVTPIKIASLVDRYDVRVDYSTATPEAPMAVTRRGLLDGSFTFTLNTGNQSLACQITQSGKVFSQFVPHGGKPGIDYDYPSPGSGFLQLLRSELSVDGFDLEGFVDSF